VAALTLYLADTSAWHRAMHPAVAAAWEQRLATEDHDRIAQITGQPVEWIAPRGSL
jgi:hypothetical protein